MSELESLVERFAKTELRHIDDEEDRLGEVGRPLTDVEIGDLKRRLGAMPADLACLLARTSSLLELGFHLEPADATNPWAIDDIPPLGRVLQLNGDGFGNYFYLEPRGERSVVWWVCHDPAEIVRCGASLHEFLTQRLAFVERASQSARDYDDLEDEVRSPRYIEAVSPADALEAARPESELAQSLAALPSNAKVFDLSEYLAAIDLFDLRGGDLTRDGDHFVFVPHSAERARSLTAQRRESEDRAMAEDLRWQEDVARRKRPWWRFW